MVLRRLWEKLGWLLGSVWLALALTAPAWAGVTEKTADEVANKLSDTIQSIVFPLGGLIVFVAVIIVAVKLITTAGKPKERAEAMESIPYIILGGLLLGGGMLIAGLVLKLMKTVGG